MNENDVKLHANQHREARVAKYLSEEFIQKIKPIEKVITSDLKEIESDTKSKLEGLEYRLKSKDSLARKIIADSKEKNISLEWAADLITDKLRYTFTNSDHSFTDKYFNYEARHRGYDVEAKGNFLGSLSETKMVTTYQGVKYTTPPQLLEVENYEFNIEVVNEILRKAGD